MVGDPLAGIFHRGFRPPTERVRIARRIAKVFSEVRKHGFENAGIVQKGGVLLAMGNYFFQSGDGAEMKVEFTFGYVRDETGRLVIQLHHSALPYRPDAVTG